MFKLLEDYEEDFDRDELKAEYWRRNSGAGGGKHRSEDEPEPEPVMPTASEYRSMLRILSKKSVPGANWEKSMVVLREAQGWGYNITEYCFQTGVCVCVCG